MIATISIKDHSYQNMQIKRKPQGKVVDEEHSVAFPYAIAVAVLAEHAIGYVAWQVLVE